MVEATVVYFTDNFLPEDFMKKIQNLLLKVSPFSIISVSQKRIDFGTNICVGEIGRSRTSIFTQVLAGIEKADTDIVFLAEHDCLYTPEHFTFRPVDRNTFYYNLNHWFVQWDKSPELDGQYSRWEGRKALSQCIGFRDSMIACMKETLELLKADVPIRKGVPGACEPGCCKPHEAFCIEQAKIKDLGKESEKWNAVGFRTILPNLDIRHGTNISGGRRGRDGCYDLPYWGDFKKVMEEDG